MDVDSRGLLHAVSGERVESEFAWGASKNVNKMAISLLSEDLSM